MSTPDTLDTRAALMRQAYLATGTGNGAMEWDDLKDCVKDQWRAVAGVDANIGYKLELTADELTKARCKWYDYENNGHSQSLLAFIQSRIVPIPHPHYCPDDVALSSRVPALEAKIERQRAQLRSNAESMLRYKEVISDFGEEVKNLKDDNRLHIEQITALEAEIARLKQPAAPNSIAKSEWRSPSQEEMNSPLFNAIWNCIKSWDINVPEFYRLYCGANGNHVMQIMDAIGSYVTPEQPVATPTDAQVEALANVLQRAYSAVNGSSLEWDEWPSGAQRGFMGEARAAYAHIAAEGGIMANVTEVEIAEAIYGSRTGKRNEFKQSCYPSEYPYTRPMAAAVMALLREKGVVDSALHDELEAVKAERDEIIHQQSKRCMSWRRCFDLAFRLKNKYRDELEAVKAERDAFQIRNDNQKDQLIYLDHQISPLMAEVSNLRDELAQTREQLDAATERCVNCGDRPESDGTCANCTARALKWRAMQAAPRPVKVRFDTVPASMRLAWNDGVDKNVSMERFYMTYLADHAVIDLPPGVPSAEELWTVAWNEMRGMHPHMSIAEHTNPLEQCTAKAVVTALLDNLAPYLHAKQPDTEVIELRIERDALKRQLSALRGSDTNQFIREMQGKQQPPDIDPVTLERLAEIARNAWKPVDGPGCWGRVVLAILAAAKPVVDVDDQMEFQSHFRLGHSFSEGIGWLNSKIRYSVRVPRAEVEALAKSLRDAYCEELTNASQWSDLTEGTRDDYRREATAALRHFGMEVEG